MNRNLVNAGALALLALALLSPGRPASANSVQPAADSKLVVSMTFQGRSEVPGKMPQLLVRYILRLGDGSPLEGKNTTDSFGHLSIDVSGLPKGTYDLWVKNSQYLANAGQVGLDGSQTIKTDAGMLHAGDADDNNVVNIQDFALVRANFGKDIKDPTFNSNADLNGDDVVNILDFSLYRANQGFAGAPKPGQ
jgi:Dockerin type I domain